ncbi:hypothetical protein [Mastigocoleus testarum]|uniref:hypothetical protein n=1 Tax=Mastigocoleus testarum TaxID=996925 RepID=UPI00128F5788|nr:hypothetical protein [Mastigocoleus testarum]
MKNRNNLLVLILSISLAAVGITGLTMLAAKNQGYGHFRIVIREGDPLYPQSNNYRTYATKICHCDRNAVQG